MLREAAKECAARKGFHGIFCRWFRFAKEPVLGLVARTLQKCEEMGAWPATVRHAILHLIPKPKGGRTPIGLVDGICRLWEFTRRPAMRAWHSRCEREHDYGAKGRTSTDAVWCQSLCDEATEAGGLAAATTLISLTKAFECVPLEHVWRRGLAMGINPHLQCLALVISRFSKHLALHG